ncbi:hypothetical protein SNN87_001292 [Cronobacter sakazakii]|uniref:hypothetical protein n=1 Tax=Cronobacter sakazakii TaxID=28141 RepID=UPI001C0CC480|nr:hypothetical protein [Cronobacter sakazakii]ELY5887220.1 hypothetical protein [Cronobacter sakazakii]
MTIDTAKLKAVPRHSVDGYGRQDICYNDPEGEFVFYSDYEALKDALEAAQRRIAELEARTLRVNMPAIRNAEMMSDLAWNSAIDHCFDALIKATDEAGINLETGGEA